MTPAEILASVAEITGVTVSAMTSKGRQSRTVYARTMATHEIRRQCLGWSLQNVGDVFGRHYTDVLHDLRRHKDLIETDRAYAAAFQTLSKPNQTTQCKD